MKAETRKHIIRLYTREKGYSLYARSHDFKFRRQPLDIESDQVSRIYIQVQERIDRVLETQKVSWTLCMRHDSPYHEPIVAYGGFISIHQGHSGTGVFFVHAIELQHPRNLYSYVDAVVRLLSPTGIRRLTEEIAEIALGKRNEDEFLESVSRSIEATVSLNPPDKVEGINEELKFKYIEHDCAGASAVSWRTMAILHLNALPPWEVYDVVESSGKIQTSASDSKNNSTISASEIQHKTISHYCGLSVPKDSNKELHAYIFPENGADEQNKNSSSFANGKSRERERGKGGIVWRNLSFLASIVIFCLTAYLINTYNNEQRQRLQELHSATETLKQIFQSSSKGQAGVGEQQATPNASTKQSELSGLKAKILEMYGENKNSRIKALRELSEARESHWELVPLLLEYADQYPSNIEGIENSFLVLRNCSPEILKRSRERLGIFLETVKRTIPARSNETERLKGILNNP